MKNRRDHILSTSRTLFNREGYSNVTIRMIALELKISSGNLNYHFKKRDDILETLYFDMVTEFDNRIKELGGKEITFKTIKEDIMLSMQRMLDYRFFWTDLYNLLKISNKIKSHFEEVYKNRHNGYQFLFNFLQSKKYMKKFEFESEGSFLIERMIGFSNTWLYNSFLYNHKIDEVYIDAQSQNLLSMLYPYLTPLGKEEYMKTSNIDLV